MTDTGELESLGRRYLADALAGARRGADPRRQYRRSHYTVEVGKSREEMRSALAHEYERWILLHEQPADRQRHRMSDTFGQSAPLIEVAVDGVTCINAEVYDHDRGVSLAISQPVEKTRFGRYKEMGPARVLGEAEPLHTVLRGDVLRYDLEPLPLEERRRLMTALRSSTIPHLTCFAEIFVAADHEAELASIDDWPEIRPTFMPRKTVDQNL